VGGNYKHAGFQNGGVSVCPSMSHAREGTAHVGLRSQVRL
jgi:hypothetical protein